jgi:hypothetical protein
VVSSAVEPVEPTQKFTDLLFYESRFVVRITVVYEIHDARTIHFLLSVYPQLGSNSRRPGGYLVLIWLDVLCTFVAADIVNISDFLLLFHFLHGVTRCSDLGEVYPDAVILTQGTSVHARALAHLSC